MSSRSHWRAGRFIAPVLLVLAAASLPGSSPAAAAASLPRSVVDRPDDSTLSQVQLLYVLASDGSDRSLDTKGTIAGSAASFQSWLVKQTRKKALRLDTYKGGLEVVFHRLSQTDAQLASKGLFIRDEIERELNQAGFNKANKLYGIYYDGSSTASCGGGAFPPSLPGNVGALYLLGQPPNSPPCAANTFATAKQAPRYWEFSMAHEMLHLMGFVPACAPHNTRQSHTSDSPTDLMYAGDSQWRPAVLDFGNDDYFRHSNSSCPDFEDSPYLTKVKKAKKK